MDIEERFYYGEKAKELNNKTVKANKRYYVYSAIERNYLILMRVYTTR